MNRGIARRTLFEGSEDIRFFLSRLARCVRRRQLEVHAYCVLTTHFHLLVRSPGGELSTVMRQVQLEYVRRFNRRRRRDGPLMRGRFTSKPVLSLTYRSVLVRYIDANPVQAGICTDPRKYPFGSASHYARSAGPPWLERSWIEGFVRKEVEREHYDPGDYARTFGSLGQAESGLVERRIASSGLLDPLDDLVHSTPAGVLSWMRWKARLADGTEPGLPVLDPTCIDGSIAAARDRGTDILLRRGRADRLAQMHAGLLRDLAGASLSEIAIRTRRSTSSAAELCKRHADDIFRDEAYAEHASRLMHSTLEARYGVARYGVVSRHPG